MPDTEEKPVANGLVALVAVAVVVGLLAGIVILVGTKVLGIGGGDVSADEADGGASLYLPDPSKTDGESGPLVTLLPTDDESKQSSESDDESEDPDQEESESEKQKDRITLSPGASQMTPGDDLYLSGVYPTGEGAMLDIEIRIEGHSWQEFPVDVSVQGSTFATYVNTSQIGKIQWRVVDKDRKLKSNVITVNYG